MGEFPDTGDGDVHRALVELAQARETTYYDDDADTQAREGYYAGLDRNAGSEELFRTLSGLVTRTHHSQPSYKPGVHLYPAVDLQPNGQLRSSYTGDGSPRKTSSSTTPESSNVARRHSKPG